MTAPDAEGKPLDIPAWREAIAWAREPELGELHWPRVLGWALDEIERLRVSVETALNRSEE